MSIFKCRFILPMIVLACLVSAQQALAAQPLYWASWEIEVGFQNDQPNAFISVEAGTYVHGQPITNYTTQQPFDCHVVGNVVFADEQAHFDGNGYLACDAPDVVQIVKEITGGKIGNLSTACDCKTPWAQAELILNENPTQTNPFNPIFTRSDLALAVPHAGNSDAKAVFTVAGETAVSNIFDLTGKDTVYSDFTRQTMTSYVPSFLVNGRSTAATPNLIQTQRPLQLSNLAETLYIGFDPSSGQMLEGSLLQLQIDPGCFGFG